jgi:DNA-binding transcriptional LysR family regulator
MRLDLDALEALAAVVREGGLARAAQKLHKAPSAVSYQLARLEEQLELSVFDRSGYRLALTPAGEAIHAEAVRVLAQADRLTELARQFRHGYEPRVTLIADGILPLAPVFTAVKAMGDARIPTRVELKIEFLRGVQYRFERDAADLMIVKDYEPSPDLVAEPLPEVTCVLCASSTHPLARRASVSRDALHDHVELSIQDSSDQGTDRHLLGGERVLYLSGFLAKRDALRLGLGFGWMPTDLVQDDLASGALAEVDYDGGSRYRFTPHLVRRGDRTLGPAGRLLYDGLRAALTAPTPRP